MCCRCATTLAPASHCVGTMISLSAWEWDKSHLAYNKYMASVLPWEIYYCLQWSLRTDVMELIEECNATPSATWEIGGAVCGDQVVVPHTSSQCFGLRQYIGPKPHSMVIKILRPCEKWGGLRLRRLPLNCASRQGPMLWVMLWQG